MAFPSCTLAMFSSSPHCPMYMSTCRGDALDRPQRTRIRQSIPAPNCFWAARGTRQTCSSATARLLAPRTHRAIALSSCREGAARPNFNPILRLEQSPNSHHHRHFRIPRTTGQRPQTQSRKGPGGCSLATPDSTRWQASISLPSFEQDPGADACARDDVGDRGSMEPQERGDADGWDALVVYGSAVGVSSSSVWARGLSCSRPEPSGDFNDACGFAALAYTPPPAPGILRHFNIDYGKNDRPRTLSMPLTVRNALSTTRVSLGPVSPHFSPSVLNRCKRVTSSFSPSTALLVVDDAPRRLPASALSNVTRGGESGALTEAVALGISRSRVQVHPRADVHAIIPAGDIGESGDIGAIPMPIPIASSSSANRPYCCCCTSPAPFARFAPCTFPLLLAEA
ncbi:hypothetical protein B0H15DRAFT_943862 [Mycena belliarum]|uniref:Uncharacterized protein n=1 Tax=Mycena belliarum TaxID=1033014 RepID=A0AAD6XWU1_9AGAR|nr:hypothetical protein B0H15DRAFT_943862 [Mycena belliae]